MRRDEDTDTDTEEEKVEIDKPKVKITKRRSKYAGRESAYDIKQREAAAKKAAIEERQRKARSQLRHGHLPYKQRMKKIREEDEQKEREDKKKAIEDKRKAIKDEATRKAVLQERENLTHHLKTKRHVPRGTYGLAEEQEEQRKELVQDHLQVFNEKGEKWYAVQHVDGDWFEISQHLIDDERRKKYGTTADHIWRLMGNTGSPPMRARDLPGGYTNIEHAKMMVN
ncbi:MAG: hypothetical protein GY804_00485 [Alphaproteobacteria bacterium]|nr:hypothetical protein [Alphaproteobacteria bacterium]